MTNNLENLNKVNSELITVYELETGEKVVLGRELHQRLEIGWDYSTWFKRMMAYEFVAEKGYIPFSASRADGKAGKPRSEHLLYIESAQEIARMQRTPAGSQILKKLSEVQGVSNEKPKNELTIFNTDLIPVYTTDKGQQVVIGRELHEKLKIETPYSIWFLRVCEDYDFKENTDYYPYSTSLYKNVKRGRRGGQNRKDHILTSDMAREIAMIQRTPEGKAIRKKLLELAKQVEEGKLPSWRIHDELERAKAWIEEEETRRALETANSELETQVEEMQPKVDCFDKFIETGESTNFRTTAALLGYTQNAFMKLLEDDRLIYRDKNKKARPYAKFINLGWFEVKSVPCNDGAYRDQAFITPKGLSALRKKFDYQKGGLLVTLRVEDLVYFFDSVIVRLNKFALCFKEPYTKSQLMALHSQCEFEAAHLQAIANRIKDYINETEKGE